MTTGQARREAFDEESNRLPDLPGVKKLIRPLQDFMYEQNGGSPFSSHETQLGFGTIVEVEDKNHPEGVSIYYVFQVSSMYRNTPAEDNLKKSRRYLYVIQQAPRFTKDGRFGAWEISREGIIKLFTGARLNYIRRCATLGSLIEEKGYDCLTKTNRERWATVCSMAGQDPFSPGARQGILKKCDEWEGRGQELRHEMLELIEKDKFRLPRRSPEINSDFRRFRN